MYGFLAGLLLLLVGYSVLQGSRIDDRTLGYLGIGILILGLALIAGSLIVQVRQNRNSR